MKVRFIGGPADGKVQEVDTPTVRVINYGPIQVKDGMPPFCDATEVVYEVHKLVGDREYFWFACEGDIDEALARLFYA